MNRDLREEEAKSFVYGTRGRDAYLQIPKWMIAAIDDLEHTAVLVDMLHLYEHLDEHNQLMQLGDDSRLWMFYTEDTCRERICVRKKTLRGALKQFDELGLIEKVRHGIPSKNYYCFNFSNLRQWFEDSRCGFSKKLSSSPKRDDYKSQKGRLGVTKGTTVPQDPIYLIEEREEEEREEKKEKYKKERSAGAEEAAPPPTASGPPPLSPSFSSSSPSIKEKAVNGPSRAKKPEPVYTHQWGRVKLTESDYEALKTTHGAGVIKAKAEEMNDYLEAHGKTYKNYAAALRNWLRKDAKEGKTLKPGQMSYDYENDNDYSEWRGGVTIKESGGDENVWFDD